MVKGLIRRQRRGVVNSLAEVITIHIKLRNPNVAQLPTTGGSIQLQVEREVVVLARGNGHPVVIAIQPVVKGCWRTGVINIQAHGMAARSAAGEVTCIHNRAGKAKDGR